MCAFTETRSSSFLFFSFLFHSTIITIGENFSFQPLENSIHTFFFVCPRLRLASSPHISLLFLKKIMHGTAPSHPASKTSSPYLVIFNR